MSGYRDRTFEFFDLTELKKQQQQSVVHHRANKGKQERSDFTRIAAQIKLDIASTAEKLERLTKLAKKKSLFEDPTIEIQELTNVINQDIKNINGQIALLQQQKGLGQSNKNKQVESHVDTIVNSLKNKLLKTTKGFSEVLEIRTENLKVQQKERESFVGTAHNFMEKRYGESHLYRQQTQPLLEDGNNNSGEVAIAMPQQHLLISQDRYLTTRADAVVNIEKTIHELQNIFRQLANLVAEQQEMIERIDRDIDTTAVNVESAHNSLLQYLSSVSSNRWLAIRVFLVLIFFIVVFVVFFV